LLDVDNDLFDDYGNLLPQDDPEPNSNDDYNETDIEDAEYILTELEHSIKQSNARVAAWMVKKAGGKLKVYTSGTIVSLAIPSKLRLRTEAKRLLCRITKVVKNRYTLICSVGPLSGTHTSRQLNSVLSLDDSSIPYKFLAKDPKLTINKVRVLFFKLYLN